MQKWWRVFRCINCKVEIHKKKAWVLLRCPLCKRKMYIVRFEPRTPSENKDRTKKEGKCHEDEYAGMDRILL